MNQTGKHIVFSGRVQGVGFRFTTLRIADRYQLSGYVRNMPDGTVEMRAQGSKDKIDECLRDIQDRMADYVRDVKVTEVEVDPQYRDFKITF